MAANDAAVSKGDGKCGVDLHQGPCLTKDWGVLVEIEAEPAVMVVQVLNQEERVGAAPSTLQSHSSS